MKGANEQMKWNVLWQLLQSRAGRIGLAPALWYGIALLTLTAVYLGTGRLGLSLGAVSSFATLVWLPSGLSVAALFLWGSRLWPAIALGAFLVSLFTGASWPVAVGISIGNTLEAVVSTALLKRKEVRPIGADFRKNGGEERTTSLICEKVQVSKDLSQEERC
ncbi:MAG TPA: MASE1 domain-containing protein, partial [Ktedonobacteraceae bacterium]|nr:MASE1 domain-containing protein [Ktedonobacteraceae bacterium]